MGEDLIEFFKEDFPVLVEGGLIAVKRLDEVSAVRMFQAAELLSPTSTAPKIGMGYVALNKLNLKEAAKIFQEVIDKEPENYLGHMLLGLSFLFDVENKDKQKKGLKMVSEAMEKSTDSTVRNLGAASIDWITKEAKKKEKSFVT